MNPPLVIEPTTRPFLQTIYTHRVWENCGIFFYPVGRYG
jgi:hypothetical protein